MRGGLRPAYRLHTVWWLAASRGRVHAELCEPLCWPQWWPGLRGVRELAAGDAQGAGRILRFDWYGLPYGLAFSFRADCVRPGRAVSGAVTGDLRGWGGWRLADDGGGCRVHHVWQVSAEAPWLRALDRWLRPLLIRNHARVMRLGGDALALRLGVAPPRCRSFGA